VSRKRPRSSRTDRIKKVLHKHQTLRRSLEQSRVLWGYDGRHWQDAFCELYDVLEEELER